MKNRVNIITAVVLMALTGLLTYVVTFSMVREDFNRQLDVFSTRREELDSFFEALDNIENRYIGGTEKDKLVQGAIDGMIKATGDPWAFYLGPDDFRAYLQSQSNQSVGIGVTVEPDERGVKITEVLSQSPAAEAGLLAGDVITHIKDDAIAGMEFNDAVSAMRGNEFTTVMLTVSRPDEENRSFSVEIMRRTVIRDPVVSGIIESARGKTGYIRIINFDDHVDTEFISKVNELIKEDVTGLIFDVRSNPGGKLSVLVRMLDHLLPEGDLITLRYKDGHDDVRTSDSECIELPMAVLINGDSYSAAEFFAACLREYDWAVLVGEKTSGKGYAQETIRLPDGSGFNLSTSEYFTSKGHSLAHVGLTPDVEVTLPADDQKHIGSMDPGLDRQLARALQELRAG
ncbi:MAG: S41 family peptidase [Oscillospiraceae bacterium]|nr:S41 family peptidase [Oscillospiraceae bacterium]